MYSSAVLSTLVVLVLGGATHSVLVKCFYQIGFTDVLLISFLGLLGQALIFPLYLLSKAACRSVMNSNEFDALQSESVRDISWYPDLNSSNVECGDNDDYFDNNNPSCRSFNSNDGSISSDSYTGDEIVDMRNQLGATKLIFKGSINGLNSNSRQANQWSQKVPWVLKPCIPGVIVTIWLVCDSLSLKYLDASIKVMITSATQIIANALAAKYIRHRNIPRQRWYGIAILVVALLTIMFVGCFFRTDESESERAASNSNMAIGLFFVLGEALCDASYGIAAEVFLQDDEFDPWLFISMKGLYGLMLMIPVNFIIGPLINEDLFLSIQKIGSSNIGIALSIAILVAASVRDVSWTVGTALTSALTARMWSNAQAVFTLIMSLIIFYATINVPNIQVGEPFLLPQSPIIMFALFLLLVGIYVYYQGPSKTVPQGKSEAGSIDETISSSSNNSEASKASCSSIVCDESTALMATTTATEYFTV